MAVDALAALAADPMAVMLGCVELIGPVALTTQLITLRLELVAVWVVAVTTNYPCSLHFALDKRPIDKDFIAYLSVGPV